MENSESSKKDIPGSVSPGSSGSGERERNFVEKKIDGFTAPAGKLKEQCSAVLDNPNVPAGSKAAAVGLAAVEAGMSVKNAVDAVKGMAGELMDKAVVGGAGQADFSARHRLPARRQADGSRSGFGRPLCDHSSRSLGTDASSVYRDHVRSEGFRFVHAFERGCPVHSSTRSACKLRVERCGTCGSQRRHAETSFRYNGDCGLEWTSNPLGSVSSASYDDFGNPVNKTSPDGGFIQLEYARTEYPYLPTSAVDKAGGRWKWEYDGRGNLQKRTNPLGAETTFEYDDGLLATVTGAKGQKTKLTYDGHFNLAETLAPDGGVNRWRYDELGRCTRYENAKNGVTEYAYNLLGDAVKIKLPDGNLRELAYDGQGNVVHAKDSERDVRFTYRGVNRLASRTERDSSLRFGYDTEDRLRFVENENGEQYAFLLDAKGNVVEETGFDGLTRKYDRDLAGRVTSVLRPGGGEVSYEYDEVGRVTKVIYADGTEETYEYRKDGLLTKAVNEDAEVKLKRDVLGRVIMETCNGETVASTYDVANSRTRITSTLGADIEAEYSLMGDLVSSGDDGGWQNDYRRDVFGLETARDFGGGLLSHTERDGRGRVVSHKMERNNRRLTEKSYLWGVNDKLLSVVTDGKETRYGYDGWGNLSKAFFEDGSVEYRNPDKSGNLFETLERQDRKYAKGGQLVKTKDWEYRYDREGNLVRKKGIAGSVAGQVWRYEWSSAGMLAKVKRPDAREVTFKYDALGRRIEKRFGNRITSWLWDGNVPLHERTETRTPDYSQERGHFDDVRPEPVITRVFEEGTFVPAAKLTEKEKFSIATNYMGTPEAMYREDGEAVWTCKLNSYGKVRDYKGRLKTDCPFRYQGQYEDTETGLYYNRFRYYSPEEGIYISQDPIRLKGGVSLYGYVHDTNAWVDIFGLSSSCDDVINETETSHGNITSAHTLTEGEALDAGLQFLGTNYREIGNSGSGVYRSTTPNSDGTYNQFRMDNNSLEGNHSPNVSHVHFEVINPSTNKPTVNNHVPITK